MKENRTLYEEPAINIIASDECDVFTLNTSLEYDPEKEDNVPSIDDILGDQYW